MDILVTNKTREHGFELQSGPFKEQSYVVCGRDYLGPPRREVLSEPVTLHRSIPVERWEGDIRTSFDVNGLWLMAKPRHLGMLNGTLQVSFESVYRSRDS